MANEKKRINPWLFFGTLAVAGLYVLWDQQPPRLSHSKAESLMNGLIEGRIARQGMVEKVRSYDESGHLSPTPLEDLGSASLVDCQVLGQRSDTGPGLYGQWKKTYGASSYRCLYQVDGPGGKRLYVSAMINKYNHPEAKSNHGGHSILLLRDKDTKELMQRFVRR